MAKFEMEGFCYELGAFGNKLKLEGEPWATPVAVTNQMAIGADNRPVIGSFKIWSRSSDQFGEPNASLVRLHHHGSEIFAVSETEEDLVWLLAEELGLTPVLILTTMGGYVPLAS